MSDNDDCDEIIARLKFISHIQKDEKVNSKKISKQSNTIMTSFVRTLLDPDNRHNTLEFLRKVVQRSFEISDQYIRENNHIASKNLLNDLKNSKCGMSNLQHTYNSDAKFCCHIALLIEKIDNYLQTHG